VETAKEHQVKKKLSELCQALKEMKTILGLLL
jgi:hypothetical protein